jgi:hypothetical protein
MAVVIVVVVAAALACFTLALRRSARALGSARALAL